MPSTPRSPDAATRLRESIAAERKRLDRRPVPTGPWIMPAGLDDLDALLDIVDAAREVVAHYTTIAPHGKIDRAVSSLKEALVTLDYVPTGERDQSNGLTKPLSRRARSGSTADTTSARCRRARITRATSGSRSDSGDVLQEGAVRDPDELMTFCQGCFVPRCGTTGDSDRCTLWRHHQTAHVGESGRREPMGATLTGAS